MLFSSPLQLYPAEASLTSKGKRGWTNAATHKNKANIFLVSTTTGISKRQISLSASPSPCGLQVRVHHGLCDIYLQQEKRSYLLDKNEWGPCIRRGLRLCCQDTGKPQRNAGIPYPGFLCAKNPTTFNKGRSRVLTPMPQLTQPKPCSRYPHLEKEASLPCL